MKNKMRQAALVLLTIGALSAMPPARAQGEWPQFRGPSGQGTSADKNAPLTWSATENLVWKTELPGAGTSSPVLWGNHLFLTCFGGFNVPGQGRGDIEQLKLQVLCLDRASGKILWATDVPPQLPEQLTIREGHGYASATPAVDAQRVYAFFGKSGVVALGHDGKVLWKADVGSRLNGWGSAASPVLAGNLLLVNASVESDVLVALDKTTGREVWRAGGIKEAWNTPIVVKTAAGKSEIVIATIGKVLGIDPENGQQLWSCTTNIAWYMVPSMVTQGDVVYCIGGRSGDALAIRSGGRGDVTATHKLWAGRKGSNVSSPLYHDGYLYWANDSTATAFCADAKTGNIVYEEQLDRGNQIYASPVLAAGRIYYVARTGKTFVVAAKPAFELLATNAAPERSTFNASPAIVNGQLFLRSDRALYCFGSK